MRAVSLSQEPALSVLKSELVCGYKDISNESYAGFSGSHKVGEQAISTTNGAGPHNLQSFIMASDGTVMHCLPGYWNPSDLVREVEFAGRLHDLWTRNDLSRTQKNQYYKAMQLNHIHEHPVNMVRRSRMQSFDMEHEVKHNLASSDTIKDRSLARAVLSKNRSTKIRAMRAFKTTDRLMHERMSKRPFVAYNRFDEAEYANYGRPLYDKSENFRNQHGQFVDNGQVVERPPMKARKQELLGKVPQHIQNRRKRWAQYSGNFKNRNTRSQSRLWGASPSQSSSNGVWTSQ